jgi:hypothetical protein
MKPVQLAVVLTYDADHVAPEAALKDAQQVVQNILLDRDAQSDNVPYVTDPWPDVRYDDLPETWRKAFDEGETPDGNS